MSLARPPALRAPEPCAQVNGRAIPVPKVSRDDPQFDGHVQKLLDTTIDELKAMYNRHRWVYSRHRWVQPNGPSGIGCGSSSC